MDIRDFPDFDGHKLLTLIHHKESGLYGFIAIHDDTLGPALGGTRMYPYQSDAEAITDVLRLSRGMTYKAALAGIKYGGGKCVLVGNPKTDKSDAYFRAYGRRLNKLGGAYITAEDVSITVADIEKVAQASSYVTGRSEGMHQNVKGSGDPSPITAIGVLSGIRATLKVAFGDDAIAGRSFAIQGLGKVGFRLARLLHEQGGRLIITDTDEQMVQRALTEFTGSIFVETSKIHSQDVDVFAPCALGAVINDTTITELQCKIVAGAANNQLATPEHGTKLHELGIFYAPDFVINAGGLINVAEELAPGGYNHERAVRKTENIFNTTYSILAESNRKDVPPRTIAHMKGEEILEAGRKLKRAMRNR
ncbi:MAG: Glu/Leu/Phe/Val dehydrogenase dimerization domain-containing protein [Candidatus Spechtbacterales bacterium]|nr:Glu/Leu/Phe/Val dehydrogenase dimerization domain-containing protein [Candidatus Spechtbacterales bacterium]